MEKGKTFSENKYKNIIIVIAGISFLLVLLLGAFLRFGLGFGKKPLTSEGWENRYFSAEDLKKYNGANPKEPIYMGYEGKVYDVSTGAGFYAAGKTYNYLTGRDATAELNEVGVGEIIVRKYPVIGKIK